MMFQQLVLNFADFHRNNSIFMQNKIEHLKNISLVKNSHFADFLIMYLWEGKNNAVLDLKNLKPCI